MPKNGLYGDVALPLAPGRSRFGISLPLIFGLAVYVLIVARGGAVLHDPDTYWHIAVGRWIIAHGAVPHHDVFSFSMPDAPWVPFAWLADILMAGIYDHFGWAGLVAATALSASAALMILLRALLHILAPVHALIATALACALTFPHVLARPHLFTLPILVAWVAGLVRARSADRAPSPWLVLLVPLWANLHGSYMFGLVIAALLGAEAVLLAEDWRARIRAARHWGLFGMLSVGAALITPFGIEGLLLPFQLAPTSYASAVLTEERSPNFQSFEPLELWIMVLLFAAFSLGWRLPPIRVGIVLLLLHMALQHARYAELLGLVAPLMLSPALAAQLAVRLGARQVLLLDRTMAKLATPATGRGIALAGAILLAVSAAALPGVMARPSDAITPAAALAAAKAADLQGPVLNDYVFGGYLIFSGVKPFIDGRGHAFYTDNFIKRYFDAMFMISNQFPQLLADYGITWTLLSPNSPGAMLLDHLPGWRRYYTDDIAVVHVREDQAMR